MSDTGQATPGYPLEYIATHLRIVVGKADPGPVLREFLAHADQWPDSELVYDPQLALPVLGKHRQLFAEWPRRLQVAADRMLRQNSRPHARNLAELAMRLGVSPLEFGRVKALEAVTVTVLPDSVELEWTRKPWTRKHDPDRVASPLRLARRMLGVPANVIAAAAGFSSVDAYNSTETGRRTLDATTQLRLERVMGLPAGTLASREEVERVCRKRDDAPVRIRIPAGTPIRLQVSVGQVRMLPLAAG